MRLPAIGERAAVLLGRLLRHRAAELQRLAALLATAGCERNHGAEERYDSDLLHTHDSTSRIACLHRCIVRIFRRWPTAEWMPAGQSC